MPSHSIADLTAFVAGTVLSALQLFLGGFVALSWTAKWFHNQPLAVRMACFLTTCYWLPCAIFVLLIPFGLFDRVWTTGTLALLGIISHYTNRRQAESTVDITAFTARLLEVWAELPRSTKAATVAVAAVFLLRIARGLIAPPLAWDALTYHLLKAGRWVQTGGWVWEQAPDAWQFYQYFPPLGDVYWAWAMLGTHTDAWLAVAGGLIWLSFGLASFSFARSAGATINNSWLAALSALSVPAALGYVTSYYVDTIAAVVITSGSALVFSSVKKLSITLSIIAVTAMSLAVGIKITFFPYLLLAVGICLLLVRSPRSAAKLLLSIPFVCVSLSWQIWLTFSGHSPFYPAPLSIFGLNFEKGQPEFLAYLFAQRYPTAYLHEVPQSIWQFIIGTDDYTPDHVNLTWMFLIILPIGAYNIARLWKSLPVLSRLTLLGLFISGLITFSAFWGPGTIAYRDIWINSMGRFFLPWYTLLIVMIAVPPYKFKSPLLYVIVLINAYIALPDKWTSLDYNAVILGSLLMFPGAAVLYILHRLQRRWIERLIICMSLLILQSLLIFSTRNHYRFKFYSSVDDSYDVGYLLNYAFPAEAFELLDQEKPQTVAFSADYGGVAYRWFRYPLLGSRLQNKVVYITPTSDGKVWSGSINRNKTPDLSFDKWNSRIATAGVDYVLVAKPFPMEADWMLDDVQKYQKVLSSKNKDWHLFKVINETRFAAPHVQK